MHHRKLGKQLGTILIDEGFVSRDDVEEVARYQTAEDLYSLFTWEHGAFEFYKGPPRDEDAIARMNDSDFGLTASVWTRDEEAALSIGSRVETGTFFMNRCDYLDPALCWTGCKDTGKGGALSVIGYHNLTRPKSYHLKKVTS